VPLGIGLVVATRGEVLRVAGAWYRAGVVVALAAGAWPYANAWVRTGNPVFPFMNALFRSPLYDTGTSFNNHLYNAPLRPWTPYDIFLDSGRFLEAVAGSAGAPGFGWLLVLPVLAVALVTRRYARVQLGIIVLAAVFFALVYVQQSYLRYLLPALLVGGAAAGWALDGLAQRRVAAVATLALGTACIAANLRYMDTGSWTNADLCRRCATDASARANFVMRYIPLRAVGDWLNANVPRERVGFLLLGASPAGYVGYSRAWNWHDTAAYAAFTAARTPDDVLAEVRRWGLTHVVVPLNPEPLETVMTAFADRYTRPIVDIANYRVALVVAPDGAGAPQAAASR
jgi:hypothetical protein